ncbi:MAG: undecaprenyl-diphosphate phosphatase [Pseudomonadota bacterium]
MEVVQLIIIALVQGVTEFLPISSSGHLVLIPHLTGWRDQGLVIDIAAHCGSLFAVLFYFRQDLAALVRAWCQSLAGQNSNESRLAWGILIGTIPVGLCGLLAKDFIEVYLRSPLVIAVTTIGFGVALYASDLAGRKQRELHTLTLKHAIGVGLAQALALVPGTSRSGITMTAGLALGYSREAAARFSFLLSIPVIALAGGWQLRSVTSFEPAFVVPVAIVTVLSALSAYLCIHLFLGFIQRIGMLPFFIYRIALGALLFAVLDSTPMQLEAQSMVRTTGVRI